MDLYRERDKQAATACPHLTPEAWLDCTEAIMWGLSQGEYIRRKRIFDAAVKEKTGEQRVDCMRAIIGKGNESCD